MATQFKNDQLLYLGRGPLDGKSLVKTYAELLSADTWNKDGALVAYNGMIVAVWLNKEDTTKNGIYFLFDPLVTTALKKPDYTLEANWHKIVEISDLNVQLSSIDTRLTALEECPVAIVEEALARAAADKAITDSIGKVAENKTVIEMIFEAEQSAKDYADSSIAAVNEVFNSKLTELSNKDTELAGLVGSLDTAVKTNAESIATIRTSTNENTAKLIGIESTVVDYIAAKIAAIILPKASTEITITDDGTLGIGEVSTDKFVQGNQTLVLCGGDADVDEE